MEKKISVTHELKKVEEEKNVGGKKSESEEKSDKKKSEEKSDKKKSKISEEKSNEIPGILENEETKVVKTISLLDRRRDDDKIVEETPL